MLSIIIPTMGRQTLPACLESITLDTGDEVLVVGDTRHDVSWVPELCKRPGFRYFEHPGESKFGCAQRDFAIRQAVRTNWLVFQDDNDVFFPGALEQLRDEVARLTRPLLVQTQVAESPPMSHDVKIACGHVDGHQFIAPNLPGKVGFWDVGVEGENWRGDWNYIRTTLDLWGGIEPARLPILLSHCA